MSSIIITEESTCVRWHRDYHQTRTLSLYFDQTDGLLGKDVNGTLLNAARLGLVFNNDYTSSVISSSVRCSSSRRRLSLM